jgi:glucose/galactose transporter
MNFKKPIFIIGMLFFVFGFVTWLNSVLIPYLRIACQLNNLASYLVAFSFYISYTVMAIPSASALQITGYKKGMSLGLFIMAAGAAIFIPAAYAKSYPLFLTGLFIQGTGLALLQTAANPYVTILGPLESAAQRIGIMGICNGIASTVAPMILGGVILENADGIKESLLNMSLAEKTTTLNNLAQRVIYPYIIIVVVLILLALLVFFSGLPEMNSVEEDSDATSVHTNRTSIFQFPHLLLGVLTLFLYVGVEVLSGDSIINYGTSQGIPISTARFFTSYTLGCMVVGYIIGIIVIPKYISQVKVLKISAIMGLIFSALALLTNGYVSVAFIALLGLANSMVWPSIWPLAINKLGKFTKTGSSFLIVAVGGGAILPLFYGWLADFKFITPHYAYIILLPCYLCILFYATKGYKMGIKN